MCVAPVLAVAASYAGYVVRNAVNTVYWDNWTTVPLLRADAEGRLGFGQVWEQTANNRVVVPRLVDLAIGRWFRYDVRIELVLAVLLLATAAVLLAVTQRRNDGGPMHRYVPAGLFLFSLVQWQTALWNTQTPRFMILALFALAVHAVCRSASWVAFALAATAAVLASLCLLDGFLVWPAVGLLLWCDGRPRRAPRVALWGSLGLLTAVVYFVGFDFTQGNTGSTADAITHPVSSLRFLLVLLGGFSRADRDQPGLAEGCGVLVLALGAWVVVRFLRSARTLADALPVALLVFVALFDVMTLIGRGAADPSFGLQSRYTTYNLLVFVAAYFALVNRSAWRVAEPQDRLVLGVVGGVGAALTVLLLSASLSTARHEGDAFTATLRTSAAVLRRYEVAPTTEIETFVCPAVCGDLVAEGAPFLEEEGYSVFAE